MYDTNNIISTRDDLVKFIGSNNKFNHINDHSLRVSEMAVNLATAVNLSSNDINQILLGSYLHDIGKIFLGIEILEGSLPLTDKQREVVINHTILGHGYLDNVTGLDKAKEIILLHHERVDGTGYPHGLLGSEIPIYVKIVSICDSYDAMTSYRAYKPQKLTHEEAVQELVDHSGTQFDAELVEVFINQFNISYSNN